MSEIITDLINHIVSKELKEFKEVSSRKKPKIIFENYKNYYSNLDKAAKANEPEQKEKFSIHADRFFMLAGKQVQTLNEEELKSYLSLIEKQIEKSIDVRKGDKMIANKLLFETIIRQFPENISGDNADIIDKIYSLMEDFNSQIVKE